MDVDAETAHVSILTTHGDSDLQISGAHYDIEGTDRFISKSYLEVGGGLSKTPDKGFLAKKTTDNGTITVDATKITFQHGKGHSFVFEGSRLTIRHQDGTMDVLLK
jgi:predicted phosphodiesterase